MAKDNRVRDAAENEESERLLSESPPPVSDGVNLKVYKQQRRAPETLAELAKLNSFDRSPSPSSPAPTNAPMTSNSPSSPPLSQATGTATSNPPRPGHARRQSSFAQPRPDGTPRTPNRVRFEVNDRQVRTDTPPTPTSTTSNGFPRANGSTESNGHIRSPSPDSDSAWLEEEDYIDGSVAGWRGGSRRGQRVPLLTDIEAPSVTVASPGNIDSEEAQDELQELMEGRRAKSGMKSAFMNMANSIIGAGIIGQPYAFRQAGLVTGIVLLVILTIMVDWTIRLIVINSKLSGANSFQATMEHCFGKSGLVAISIAQFALDIAKRRAAKPIEAFVCHHNSLLIYGSLKKPTLDRFARVTHFSTSISMAACLTMALAGYLNFGDKTKGNVLNNFPSDNVLVNIARLYVSGSLTIMRFTLEKCELTNHDV
ncbi:MAG: hypothetical protein M1820_004827 [Bogoriella megaspora]|nr:MAG: hypothetical protein M1820_004827 [Bogoriella megaspora]